MEKIEFDGMVFGPGELKDNREGLTQLRDSALKGNNFEWAVLLSHTIAILAHVIREMEK